MALLVRTACPEGCTDVLASVFDLLMDFSLRYITKEGVSRFLKTCRTPLHILVKRIIRKFSSFMWNVRRHLYGVVASVKVVWSKSVDKRGLNGCIRSWVWRVGGSNLQFTVPNDGTAYLWTPPRAAGGVMLNGWVWLVETHRLRLQEFADASGHGL
ncbi:hypothetical protein F2Q68_00021266 [Brassica cretica]|uniref:Uncharacterized protein n=1 Tax=Brassica cretica TaxID=69181 RepID=A0A8S9FU03_BRACR|nr:hypothetical protein F2Q68_00021266 [Brassica cretica]